MHLNAIKLSGFKSFVDSTHFDMHSQCVGVVGPNGCGKSNIMDAVRWVLGESRAGELRGESMQDVIFNGSTTRKPSYKASVELVFDNNSGRLQGEWGSYSEVSVKRSLSRDGNSNYYINNQVVRRRDIHDMFMGTGLGPKAYAIIGQGMISRIIEARPEDLRIFLEEAAGVSKYKERRKETQTRLQDAQENLLRVQDLLSEIYQQLEKLQGQASIALEYKTLHKNLLEYEYLYLSWCILHEKNKQQNMQAQYAKLKTEIEQINSQILDNEYQQNTLTDNNALYLQQLNDAQQQYNQINQYITQLEERKHYQSQQKQTLDNALKEANFALEEQIRQIDYLQEQKEVLQEQLEEVQIQKELEIENDENNQLETLLLQEKNEIDKIQKIKDNYNHLHQQVKLLEQKQQLLLQNIGQKYNRYQKLQQELDSFQQLKQQNIEILQIDLTNQKDSLKILNQELADLQSNVQIQQKKHSEYTQKVQTESIEINRLQANFDALQSLDTSQNPQVLKSINEILNANANASLDNNSIKYLNNLFKIPRQWETALANILQHRVNAFYIDNNDNNRLLEYLQNNQDLTQGLCFAELSNNYPLKNLSPDCILNYIEIRDIKITGVLQQWLSCYHVIDTMQNALQKRKQLAVGHAYILADGSIIDAFSITCSNNTLQNALINKRKLEDLTLQIKAQHLILEQAKTNMLDSLNIYNHLQQTYQQVQQKIRTGTQSIQEQDLALEKLKQQQEFAKTRMQTHEQDMHDLQHEMASEREQHAELSFTIEELIIQQENVQENLLTTEQEYKYLKQNIDKYRQQQQQKQLKVQAIKFKYEALKQNLQRNLQDTNLTQDNIAKAKLKIEEWQQQIYELQPHITEQLLEQSSIDKDSRQNTLTLAQNTIGEYHQQVQQLQYTAKQLQNNLLPLYEELHKIELNLQATTINYEQYQHQLNEITFNLQKAADLPDIQYLNNLNITAANNIKQNIQSTKLAIEKLGHVNLAAIEELEQTTTRYNILNEQLNDVKEAITTLENAIIKIDEETRELLKITFNTVNHEFGILFPELFGGGQAKLSLVGEDMLSAGVQVIAQPPGKKNVTIHLLSGGEKALTAIALVFAIFALNPAPFCLLDEVDAPLDDANTERYAKLIKKMSIKTQFLFISHNKIAMEIADQLIGVTMQEQGVSRIVSVDMVEAMQTFIA